MWSSELTQTGVMVLWQQMRLKSSFTTFGENNLKLINIFLNYIRKMKNVLTITMINPILDNCIALLGSANFPYKQIFQTLPANK